MSEVLDLFQVTHVQSLLNQQIVNTYTYVLTTYTSNVFAAATQLGQLWRSRFLQEDGLGFQCGVIVDNLASLEIRVQNLYNVNEFYAYLDGTAAGTSIQEPMPPFVAFSFRTPWLGPNIRRGFKRIAGVPENYGVTGVLSGGAVGALAGFTQVLNESLTLTADDETITFHPCVVKRVKYVTESGGDAYRMPENAQEGVFDIVQEWGLLPNVTTQNSRKIGYGA